MSRKNNSGIIAIIITIIVTGGLVYLGVSNTRATASATPSTNSPASHHGGATGPLSNLQSMVGQPAPDFKLLDHSGQEYSLAGLRGKNIILFFNEGLMCYPACWNQIASLSQDARFKDPANNVAAFSIVTDATPDWQKAIAKMPELGQATVLHDVGAKISSAYGMLTTRSSMHYGQLPGHSYVLIDKDGIIRHVYDDATMAIHNDQLAEELKKLSA